jgi:hypothetical protein
MLAVAGLNARLCCGLLPQMSESVVIAGARRLGFSHPRPSSQATKDPSSGRCSSSDGERSRLASVWSTWSVAVCSIRLGLKEDSRSAGNALACTGEHSFVNTDRSRSRHRSLAGRDHDEGSRLSHYPPPAPLRAAADDGTQIAADATRSQRNMARVRRGLCAPGRPAWTDGAVRSSSASWTRRVRARRYRLEGTGCDQCGVRRHLSLGCVWQRRSRRVARALDRRHHRGSGPTE